MVINNYIKFTILGIIILFIGTSCQEINASADQRMEIIEEKQTDDIKEEIINNKTQAKTNEETKIIETNDILVNESNINNTINNVTDVINEDELYEQIHIPVIPTKEDELAKSWVYIFTVCLFICIILFIYNLIRCYTKNPIVQTPQETSTYSKELQRITATEDDAILDLP